MKEIVPQIKSWIEAHEPFVLATVVHTWGSAPRKTGAHMAIHQSGVMVGSVSGGCVEGDVVKHALALLQNGQNEMLDYSVSDEQAWNVGLTCGGSVQIFLEPFFSINQSGDAEFWSTVTRAVDSNEGAVIAHTLNDAMVKSEVINLEDITGKSEMAGKAFAKRTHGRVDHEGQQILFEVVPRNSKLLIVGAAHVTADLVHFARQMDFETVVVDPRGFFAEGTNFKTPPDQLLTAWPEEALSQMELDPFTYAVTLSHQPRIDDQALQLLLKSDVAYIGALGSRKSHAKRKARLLEAGFSDEEIDRIHAPVGVDIHAASAREIALSIIAQVIQVKNQFM